MRYRWEAALVFICAIWGSTFVLVQRAVAHIPPFRYLSFRFALAAVALAAIGGARGLTRRELRAGCIMGVALFAGYAFQTVGLQHTSASNAGFITGMFVVITPLLEIVVARAMPTATTSAGVFLATAGLFLLAAPAGVHLRYGDALELACAASFSAHFIVTGRYAPGMDPLRLTMVQCAFVAAASSAWSLSAEHGGARGPFPWIAVLVGGLAATALAFTVQTRAQQEIPPTRTAVILSAEPVFAGLFGYWFGDRLGARGYAGAALIMLGIFAVELRRRPARDRRRGD